MIFRLQAHNWERLSPDYGSHIIMHVHLWHIFTYINSHTISFTSPILNSGARDNIFHITQYVSSKYTSALVNSLPPTDYFPPASPYTSYQGHCRWANCTQRLRSSTSPAYSTSSAGGSMRISAHVQQPSPLNIDLHLTVREQQVQTSNHNIYGQVQSRPEYTPNTCKYLNCYTTPPPPPSTKVL